MPKSKSFQKAELQVKRYHYFILDRFKCRKYMAKLLDLLYGRSINVFCKMFVDSCWTKCIPKYSDYVWKILINYNDFKDLFFAWIFTMNVYKTIVLWKVTYELTEMNRSLDSSTYSDIYDTSCELYQTQMVSFSQVRGRLCLECFSDYVTLSTRIHSLTAQQNHSMNMRKGLSSVV